MKMRNIGINEYYHIYSRGTDKRLIFMDDSDKNRFTTLLYLANGDSQTRISNYFRTEQALGLLSLFEKDVGKPLVAIGAWCLMSNHIHLLVKEIEAGGISKFMARLLTAYSMYFNIKNNRTGALFESRFKAEHVNNDTYLKYLYCYIHLNPIKMIQSDWKTKGIFDAIQAEKFISAYPYSSLSEYKGEERIQAKILSRAIFPEYFETPESFDLFYKEWIDIKKQNEAKN